MEKRAVRLEGVRKTFLTFRGAVTVLDGIDLTVEPGELFVLLGPSGCGKSTLLNLVAGLEKPSGGRIRIGDRVVAEPSQRVFLQPFERDVAMVFQSYALYPHMTVEQNIAFPMTNLRPRPNRETISDKVREAARLLRIEELLDRKPLELSGGQRQRVAIGRAIVREPAVFLLDEPLSNLDAQLRMDMRAQLKALQQKLGVTTIYVTHDQMEAMTLGDRIAILKGGHVQQLGNPIEIYDHPANPFVARFIGAPPMNLLEGELVENEAEKYFDSAGLHVSLPESIIARMHEGAAKRWSIGIRPEHMRIGPPGQGACDVDIEVVENIGGEFLVYVFTGDGQIVIRTPHHPDQRQVSLSFEAEQVHVFPGSDTNGQSI